MLILLAMLSVTPPKGGHSAVQATASIQVLRGTRNTKEDWQIAPRHNRRERIFRDEQGRVFLLRTIEHE